MWQLVKTVKKYLKFEDKRKEVASCSRPSGTILACCERLEKRRLAKTPSSKTCQQITCTKTFAKTHPFVVEKKSERYKITEPHGEKEGRKITVQYNTTQHNTA